MMLTRYFFMDEFTRFQEIFESYPHAVGCFHDHDYIRQPGTKMESVHYITSGLTQVSVVHDTGEEKILGFWGAGGLFPLICSQQDFYLEHSILQRALGDVAVLTFSTDTFRKILADHPNIAYECIDHYCKYTNLLIFHAATTSYEPILTRICNLLYTYLYYRPNQRQCVDLSQKDIASIVGTARISVARSLAKLRSEGIVVTSRGRLYITDLERLKDYTSEYCK